MDPVLTTMNPLNQMKAGLANNPHRYTHRCAHARNTHTHRSAHYEVISMTTIEMRSNVCVHAGLFCGALLRADCTATVAAELQVSGSFFQHKNEKKKQDQGN